MKTLRTAIFLLCTTLTATSLCHADETVPKYYLANWESLRNYQVPEWYKDAKFGLWTHWGVYSVPGYRGTHAGEWYPRWMYLVEDPSGKPFNGYDQQGAAIMKHHRKTYGDPSTFGYHDLVPMWKAEKWAPDEWAQFATDCGAKFFTITGMHHDGFALYDSDYTQWDSVDKGPKRDLTGDLAAAVRAKGLKFGISNHFAHNRNYYGYYFKNGFDKINKSRSELTSLYSSGKMDDAYVERWWNITTEMARKYNPDLYYFDWGWDGSFWKEQWPQFFSYYYNHAIRSGKGVYGKPGVVINYKRVPAAHGAGVKDLERGRMRSIQTNIWQTDTSISDHSWGYSVEDTFKSPHTLISLLVDIVSKNGVLMLNFGPKADGTIPDECSVPLLEMGEWLKANGEAIFASRPWEIAEEGPTEMSDNTNAGGAYDIRYTQSKDGKKVYATSFGLPDGPLTLMSTKVTSKAHQGKVTMLANGRDIPYSVNDKGQLVLDLSSINQENAGCKYAYSFCLSGFTVHDAKISPWELAKVYVTKIANDPLSETYGSSYPYISGIKPTIQRAHNGVKRNTNYWGKTIKIGGKNYSHGLMVCPAANAGLGFFVIDMSQLPNAKRFTADIGIDDAATERGSSEFIIEANVEGKWQELYKSKVLTTEDRAEKIVVEIPRDTKFIALRTTDGGNGCNADHAVWADAKFAN